MRQVTQMWLTEVQTTALKMMQFCREKVIFLLMFSFLKHLEIVRATDVGPIDKAGLLHMKNCITYIC